MSLLLYDSYGPQPWCPHGVGDLLGLGVCIWTIRHHIDEKQVRMRTRKKHR
ncbi:hypothetical protein L195_g006541 [Trifolium pratense]|uniref:Uncharacterized protein n=1 Tax=Trifolium pratense TaxID=57577 RepID=A0A2K3P3Z4_TRIPR|nr:hypothetical protein L195_g006541 [Trifolium pratense]